MIWDKNWRETSWSQLETTKWDIIIIGGGITGAGILHLATSLGLKVLLVEQRDFAWGTSSRSSKMVHGGLRYLKQGNILLVRESVRERQQLLKDLPGLVDPLSYLMPSYKKGLSQWIYHVGLTFYDWLAGRADHRYHSAPQFELLAPNIRRTGLVGGFQFSDAQTDDARLVLRVIREGVALGGTALNYVRARQLLLETGQVGGVRLENLLDGRTAEVRAPVVINASGAWSDELRRQLGETARLRPLRGSHLVFSSWRLPVAQVVSFSHPADGRPVFVYPWEGVSIVGTTDLDHVEGLETEPSISRREVDYLMEAVNYIFPGLQLTTADVVSSWAGVRPVVSTGQADPSKEARDSVIWLEKNLLTVTGGKLTTYRAVAHQALTAVKERFSALPAALEPNPPFRSPGGLPTALQSLGAATSRRLQGRYGPELTELVAAAQPHELQFIPHTVYLWAELRWAIRAESVAHLDDLLLRRVRLGMLLPDGGAQFLPRVREICRQELGWSDERWHAEETAYLQLWRTSYSLPEQLPLQAATR